MPSPQQQCILMIAKWTVDEVICAPFLEPFSGHAPFPCDYGFLTLLLRHCYSVQLPSSGWLRVGFDGRHLGKWGDLRTGVAAWNRLEELNHHRRLAGILRHQSHFLTFYEFLFVIQFVFWVSVLWLRWQGNDIHFARWWDVRYFRVGHLDFQQKNHYWTHTNLLRGWKCISV